MFKQSIIDYLIENGYFLDKVTARTYIMSGQVYADGKRIMQADNKISKNAFVEVIGQKSVYASTNGYKLENALNAFGISLMGKYGIDIFASRGSISQAMLSKGAAGVYTFFKDKRIISKSLLNNPRCRAIDSSGFDENSLISALSTAFPPAEIAVLHSKGFAISKYIPYFRHIVTSGDIIWHLRPIDEVNNVIIKKLGTLSQNSQAQVLKSAIDTINSYEGMAVNNICFSEFIPHGVAPEYFIHIKLGDNILPFNIDNEHIDEIVNYAFAKNRN